MSKYNLSDILNEYIGGGRIGTLKISFKDLQDKMDDLEQSGKVIVREKGSSADGKVYREFEVVDRDSAVPGGNKQERGFTVYDYKFGFDPAGEDYFMNEYPFSVGGNDLISHYIDMFMGEKHPGSLHGEQVGVATLLLSKMQNDILNNSQPPQFSEINHDLTIFENIFGKDAGINLHKQFQNKLFTQKSLTEINKKLLKNWGSYKKSLITFAVQTDKIKKSFINCGAACTNSDLNIPNDFYKTAIENAYYLRDRFSYLDIMQYLGRIDKYSKNLI